MYKVFVHDEEFESAAQAIENACKRIDAVINSYVANMEAVCDEKVMTGECAEALKTYLSYAKELKGVAGELAEYNTVIKDGFLDAIDKTDTYLF